MTPREGRVQVYTGPGKGKTTAALGLGVRAALAGLRVFVGQFMKGTDYAELGLRNLGFPAPGTVEIVQYGTPRLICQGQEPGEDDIAGADAGLVDIRERLASGDWDVVVADEITVALHFGLVGIEDVLGLVDARPPEVELVITGRKAPDALVERADLVTEMREVKHYYAEQGLTARKGIEF